jgi:dihydroflavonol-4-reductase
MPLLVAGGFDWVDVRDVVAGARAAERCGRTGERYLLSGQWCTVRQLADMVADVSRVAAHRITVPAVVARWAFCVFATVARLARRSTVFTPEAVDILQRHRQVSSDKAVRELDYRARPLRQTLADTITWFRSRSVTS